MTVADAFISIPVAVERAGYEVIIGAGALAQIGVETARIKPYAKALVVADHTTAGLFGPMVEASLAQAGIVARTISVAPGEASKSFGVLESICNAALDLGVDRQDCLVALGGGVVGDLAGLAAGLIKRGVDYIQAPTTLLAQVDSSVGGKTAIDTHHGKNLIGLFHQPRLVIADPGVLQSLPARECRAGLAEVIKYGLIDDAGFFEWCAQHQQALSGGDANALMQAVAVSVRAKARIVALDEREAGPRALLNLGHTFGHAVELLCGMDGALVHGEAVGLGMRWAFEVSARLGLCAPADAARVGAVLAAFGLPTRSPEAVRAAGVDAILAAMAQDKKNEGGRLTLILARGIGKAFVVKDAPRDQVREFLRETVYQDT